MSTHEHPTREDTGTFGDTTSAAGHPSGADAVGCTVVKQGRTSRWSMLRTVLGAAAASLGGTALLSSRPAGAVDAASYPAGSFSSSDPNVPAVNAQGSSGAGGVTALSSGGTGISAVSITGYGVHASSYYGGTAVFAESNVHAGQSGPAVQAASYGNGAGVISYSAYGTGIVATAGNGRGGIFTGSVAALQLMPSTAPTHPATGQPGDLFVDAAHRLWYCLGGSGWKQLA